MLFVCHFFIGASVSLNSNLTNVVIGSLGLAGNLANYGSLYYIRIGNLVFVHLCFLVQLPGRPANGTICTLPFTCQDIYDHAIIESVTRYARTFNLVGNKIINQEVLNADEKILVEFISSVV